ncbi:MAG: tetratricopeptide repeat protein [bacterium]
MPEVTLEQVPPKVKDMFNRGFVAMERDNLDYAIDMFAACVQLEPTFYQARKFLRAAEIKRFKIRGESRMSQTIASLVNLPTLLTATMLLKSGKPFQALQSAEKLLTKAPLSLVYIKLLTEAAEAAGEFEIAIQTLDMAREHFPQDTFILERLGHLYMETDQPRLGRECFELLCVLKPHDSAAVKSLKDAMAIDSMTKDGWAEAHATGASFRKMIRDEKTTELLEKEAKAVKGQNDIDALIAENRARIQREPGNINYRRALATLYSTNGRYDEAINALQEAQTVSGGRDPQIDQALTTIRLHSFDAEIKKLTESGMSAAVEAKQRDRALFIFNDIQDRISRYPTDLGLKFEYGVLLFHRDRINEAIQQFQAAQRNAQRRVSSLVYIGLCFKAKQQYDMAIEQLQKAVTELPVMDDQKKTALYELGLLLETVDRRPEAMDCFKQIYQVDIGYRDVASRVERGYKPAN